MSVSVQVLISRLLLLLLLVSLAGCGDSSPSRSFSPTDPVAPVDPIDPLPPVDPPPPGTTTYTVSGTITAVAGSAVDSDTNEPLAFYAANDDPLSAQSLANPVMLGGYATALPTGVSGDRYELVPDIQDWYRVTLAVGQTIILTLADHDGDPANLANPDFDLFMVDPVTQLDVQTSEGLGRQESITVLVGGDYYLQVYAFTAGTNYTLSIGQTPATALSPALRIEDEFVPGEAIVRFHDPAQVTAGGVATLSLGERSAALGLIPSAGQPGEPMLFRLDLGANVRTQSVSDAARRSKGTGSAWQQAKRATLDRVKALRRRADVASADLNYIRRPQLVPDDSYFPSQWNASMINLPQAWDLTTGDAAVVVAVLDTGVLFNHPDLAGRLCTALDDCRGYDFVADPLNSADGDGIDPDPADPGDQSLPDGSSSFHGTHVAGIVGAAGNNATGVAGVDWAARIMPVRVIGVAAGTSYDVIQGMRYAAGLSNDSGTLPVQTADILNLSLGGGGYSQTEQDLVTQLSGLGIFVVAAAGNEASGLPNYPAAYADVISVSAVDINKQLTYYSNYGPTIDLAAPGGNLATDLNGDGFADGVMSTAGDDSTPTLAYTYAPYMGTSMATPQVAGVAALMLAADPALTPADFDVLLAAGSLTEDLGADGAATRNDSFGYGLIDAQKAVLAALNLAGGGVLPPSLAISPSLLNFGTTATSLPLTLANAGGGTFTVTNVSFTAPWITAVTLTNETTPASGLGDYTVTIDRTGLADAVYTAAITVTTDIPGSTQVTVLMQVGTSGVANAGFHSILLVDPVSGTPLQTVTAEADPVTGTYSYRFTGVAPGSYQVNAGTDSDHDGQICDQGEACGSYPLLATPGVIEVINADRTGIDFSSGFR